MFAWDLEKAKSNQAKHGVSFEEAATAFLDPEGLDGNDTKHSINEPRNFRVALSAVSRVLTVIYTVRERGNGKEEIRIISARQASRKERSAYLRRGD